MKRQADTEVPVSTGDVERIPERPEERLSTPPEPIVLASRSDITLVTQGLDKKADALEKLAESAKKEGKHRMARELEIDVAAIRERILPEFQEQRELPLATHESLMESIIALVHDEIHRAVEASPRPRASDIERRLAIRIEDFAERVFKAGWGLGFQARKDDVELVTMRCADQARHAADEREKGKQTGVGG